MGELLIFNHWDTSSSPHKVDAVEAVLLGGIAFAGIGDDVAVGGFEVPTPFAASVFVNVEFHFESPFEEQSAGALGSRQSNRAVGGTPIFSGFLSHISERESRSEMFDRLQSVLLK
jgi:hypothetical protein